MVLRACALPRGARRAQGSVSGRRPRHQLLPVAQPSRVGGRALLLLAMPVLKGSTKWLCQVVNTGTMQRPCKSWDL